MDSITAKTPEALEILRYLQRHPEAEDTLEGIVEWWLLDYHIRRRIADTERILEELTSEGFLLKRTRYSSERFRINPKKRAAIDELLRKTSEQLPKH